MPGSGRYSSVSWSMILQCGTTVRYCITAQILERRDTGAVPGSLKPPSDPRGLSRYENPVTCPTTVNLPHDLGYRSFG